QAGRRVSDSNLLAVMERFLDCDRHVLVIEALQRASVGSHDCSGIRERIEIAADRHTRDVEPFRQFLDRGAFLFVEQLQDAPTPFLDEESHALSVGHPHTQQCVSTELEASKLLRDPKELNRRMGKGGSFCSNQLGSGLLAPRWARLIPAPPSAGVRAATPPPFLL